MWLLVSFKIIIFIFDVHILLNFIYNLIFFHLSVQRRLPWVNEPNIPGSIPVSIPVFILISFFLSISLEHYLIYPWARRWNYHKNRNPILETILLIHKLWLQKLCLNKLLWLYHWSNLLNYLKSQLIINCHINLWSVFS